MLAAAASAGGCAGAAAGTSTGDPAPTSTSSAAPPPVPTVRASAPSSIRPIGDAEQSRQPFFIMPVSGRGGAALVGRGAHYGKSCVRLWQPAGLGPVRCLGDGRFVSTVFERPAALIVTSDGEQTCVAPLEEGASRPSCRALSPRAALHLGGGIALVDEHLVKVDPATHVGPVPHEVRIHRADRHGAFAPDPEATGLSFVRAGPTMGLLGAVALQDGAQLFWFEPRRGQPGVALKSGRLGLDGRYDPPSEHTLIEGAAGEGSVAGYERWLLLSARNTALLLTERSKPPAGGAQGGWESWRLTPTRVIQRPAAPLMLGIDPLHFLVGKTATAGQFRVLQQIARLPAARAAGQPSGDVDRITWVDDRGLFVEKGELRSVERSTAAVRTEPHPFVTSTRRIHWGALAPSGHGLAATPAGYVHLAPDGSLQSIPTARATAPESRPPGGVALIGEAWWALQPSGPAAAVAGLVRLVPSDGAPPAPPLVRVDPWLSALVGGSDQGMLLTLRAGALERYAVTTSGAASRLTDGGAITMRPGFVAVQRLPTGGGALVVGERLDGRQAVLAIDRTGRLIGRNASPLDRSHTAISLTPLPAGGALLRSETAVVWLDARGHALHVAARPRPPDARGVVCMDGRSAPRGGSAASEPGRFAAVPAFQRRGACVMGQPVWATDGSLRWFGAVASGLSSTAEVGIAAAEELGLPAAASAPPTKTPASAGSAKTAPPAPSPRCPADMVLVAASYCVDRFESRLHDAAAGVAISPDFPLDARLLRYALRDWARWRTRGNLYARALPLPSLPAWFGEQPPAAMARNAPGLRPSGYVSGTIARAACGQAGKRLCSRREFVEACRGEDDTAFPYGPRYDAGACNVGRMPHPAAALHDSASGGLLDPRLNRVAAGGQPLLRLTGSTPRCRSRWGHDAIYDMVGNLDEWVDHRGGAFAGGSYSRHTRAGCRAFVNTHPKHYLDYSTGLRCCRDAAPRRPDR